MTSRKRQKEGQQALQLALVFFIFCAVSTIVIFGGWILFEFILPRRKVNGLEDFEQTNDELQQEAHLRSKLKNIESRIQTALSQGGHLSRRQDGFFYNNSKLGKELNSQLNILAPEKQSTEENLNIIQSLPTQRLEEWTNHESYLLAFRTSTVVYISSFIIGCFYTPEWISSLSLLSSLLINFDNPNLASAFSFASLCGLATLIFCKFTNSDKIRDSLSTTTEQPSNNTNEGLQTPEPTVDRTEASTKIKAVFLVTVFSMFSKLAKSDGLIDKSELKAILRIMREDFMLSTNEVNKAIAIFNKAKSSSKTFEDYADLFLSHFSDSIEIKTLVLDALFIIAYADKNCSTEEENLLLYYANSANIENSAYQRIKSRSASTNALDKYYLSLNCDKNASLEEVKRQYKLLRSQFHPDKIASKGLPKEFIKFAESKYNEIQFAYQEICRAA